MSHPASLHEFALGALDDAEAEVVLAHLAACRRCRDEVRRLRESAAIAGDALAPIRPDPGLRDRVLAAVRPELDEARRAAARPRQVTHSRVGPWGAAAALVVVLVASGLAIDRHASYTRAESERSVVAAWLTREDVTTWRLGAREAAGRSPGTMMVADDGTVLVVLRSAPPRGRSYQVWGHGEAGAVALGSGRGTVLRVDASGFEEVGVSIEPFGGSPEPTAPLGRAPLPGGS